MADDNQKIVVEVPNGGNFSPLPTPYSPPNKLEQFRQGWINAIALPDNPTDLIFEITASVTIPALVTSCWASLPIPSFIRVGGLIALVLAALVLWQMLDISEIRNCLTFRLILVTVGVAMGL